MANDFRAVFWVAVIPALLSVALLVFAVHEPSQPAGERHGNPIRRENLRRLGRTYWWVVAVGAVFTLARFSEAFLILRAQQGGLATAWTPLVLIAMNLVYSVGAYPFGKLSDKMSHRALLAWGLAVLIAADLLLAASQAGPVLWGGIALWGLHMAMTQGLLSAMVAKAAPILQPAERPGLARGQRCGRVAVGPVGRAGHLPGWCGLQRSGIVGAGAAASGRRRLPNPRRHRHRRPEVQRRRQPRAFRQ